MGVHGTWSGIWLENRDCSSYSLRNEQPKHELIEVMMQEIEAKENMDLTTLIEMEKWNNGNYKENRKVGVTKRFLLSFLCV